jgi:nitrogen-specific signal transduction histidine kinase
MKKANLGDSQSNNLTHELINRLSVIVGNCDLLKEELPEASKGGKRLRLIQDAAKTIADQLKKHQGNLDAAIRPTVEQNSSASRQPRL